MSAADHVVRLDEIADPTAFLMGARIPLRSTHREQVEWIGDDAFYRINDSFEREFLLKWLDDDEERPTGIADEVARRLSLDCADPAVAAWVDRKIAEAQVQQPIDYAELVIEGRPVDWVVNYKTVEGQWHLFAARKLVPATIVPNPKNIPTARAALLRHLYGVKK